ncbi:hypothetical protein PTKIN_Ptkin04bG0043200 [Pterospermum kingtungense]
MVYDLIKLRLAHWIKAKWPDLNMGILDHIFSHPDVAEPPCDPGAAGIEGVLRNHLGCELFRLSKSVGVLEANLAELLAVREAFVIFISTVWVIDHSLIIESDSKSVVCWIANPQLAPGRYRNFVNHIESLKRTGNKLEDRSYAKRSKPDCR